jgi:hypothetical protein
MAYMTFTDALMQAKRASQLRGLPFSTTDTSNLQSAYMTGAAERAGAGRAAALAEKTLAGQKRNFADTLAQEKELSGTQLTQAKGLADASMTQTKTLSDADLAQKKAVADASLLQQKTLSDATLTNQRQLAADKLAADKAIAEAAAQREREAQAAALAQQRELEAANAQREREAQAERLAQEKELARLSQEQQAREAEAQMAAQDSAGTKALTGNVLSTGVALGGAYLMSGAGTGAGAAAGGAAAGGAAAGGAAAGGAGSGMATLGYAAAPFVAAEVLHRLMGGTGFTGGGTPGTPWNSASLEFKQRHAAAAYRAKETVLNSPYVAGVDTTGEMARRTKTGQLIFKGTSKKGEIADELRDEYYRAMNTLTMYRGSEGRDFAPTGQDSNGNYLW